MTNRLLTTDEWGKEAHSILRKAIVADAARTPAERETLIARMSKRDQDYVNHGIGPFGGYGDPLRDEA